MALASFFGSLAIQHVMSGQAAVAVVISLLQLLSVILAVGANSNSEREQKSQAIGFGSANTSAVIFFSTSTAIIVVALVAHWYLQRMPIYRDVMASFETHAGNGLEEEEALLPPDTREEAHETAPVKVLHVSER
jgi:equilibrative nucleoside transporter 1/2/3